MAKIAILYEVLGRSKGGIEAWIYHASEELLKQGHEVTLFHTMEVLPEDAAPVGSTIVNIPRHSVSPSVFFLRSMYNTKKFLRGRIEAFDIVWVRSFRMAWAASQILPPEKTIYINAAPYAYYVSVPFSFSKFNKNSIIALPQTISNQLSYIVAKIFEKNAIKKCTNVYLSEERKRQTLSFFNINDIPGKYNIIPPGVNINRFSPGNVRFEGDGPIKVISVCRLSRDKNVQCILKSIAILKSKMVDVLLTVVGEGPYKENLESLVRELSIEDSVVFVGRKENVEDWYRQSHLFVLPSLYEGFGSVYVEAMASGLPCIAISSKSGKFSVASDEIIDHNETGFLMYEDSESELAGYLLEMVNSPQQLSQLGVNGRAKVLKCFSWKITVEKLIGLSS